MQFREVKTSTDELVEVQHLSGGRIIRTINNQHVLWPKYLADKADDKLAAPVVSDPVVPTLDDVKIVRQNEVDSKSQALLAIGFTYNGAVFGMEEKEQERWKEMLLASEAGLLSSKTVYDKSKVGHVLSDSTEITSFCAAFMYAREGVLEPGRVIKSQIEAASSQAELDAIVDAR